MQVFQGIYLILDIHAYVVKLVSSVRVSAYRCIRRGEAGVLAQLSRMSAKVAEHIHLDSLEKLEKERLKLRSVAVRAFLMFHSCFIATYILNRQMQMIKYSLALSSDVCSGMSEYSQYFTALRKVRCSQAWRVHEPKSGE